MGELTNNWFIHLPRHRPNQQPTLLPQPSYKTFTGPAIQKTRTNAMSWGAAQLSFPSKCDFCGRAGGGRWEWAAPSSIPLEPTAGWIWRQLGGTNVPQYHTLLCLYTTLNTTAGTTHSIPHSILHPILPQYHTIPNSSTPNERTAAPMCGEILIPF